MILCDAGVLLCLVDRAQPQHNACRNAILRLASTLVTTWSCLTEAMYLALHRGGWSMPKQLGQLLLDRLLMLGLDLRLQTGELRFYHPATGEILLTHEEEVQRSRSLAAQLRELGIDPDTV